MLISEFGGESAVIKLIESLSVGEDSRVVVGYGDDAAVLRIGGKLSVVTTDLLAENTHFRRKTVDPYSLGWKAAAVNISDIAAMGAVPTFGFVSIAFPDIEIDFIKRLYEGMNDISGRFGSRIIGGDTNRVAGDIVINVVQLGDVEESSVCRRSTARPGHRILVTGSLGDSLAGFKLLESYGLNKALEMHPEVVERHLKPVPRVREARAGVEKGLICAMMDLSDGLGIDLGKMCEASGVGARIMYDRLPVSRELESAAHSIHAEPAELAASGGEDYELLMAAAPEDVNELIDAVYKATGTKVTEIGEFVEGRETILIHPDGRETTLEPGWKHF